MKITEVRGYQVSCQLPEPAGSARGFFNRRDSLLVEIVTDAGVSGWGETWVAAGLSSAVVRDRFCPILLGQNPFHIGALWRRMVNVSSYDRRSAPMVAVSAVDIALHDLCARANNVPISTLLGGGLRDRLLAYASGPFMKSNGHPYRAYKEEVDGYLKMGFRAIKARAGVNPHEDGVMANAMRAQVGPEVALTVDFNQGYTAQAAIDSARRMADAHLLWIEEPVGQEDLRGYQAVARQAGTAIAGGEAWASPATFRDFFTADTVAIVQPDLGVCGGFTGMRNIVALADAFDLPIVPHVWGTIVCFYASLQLAAVLPARNGGGPAPYPFFEFERTANELLRLRGDPPLNSDGTISIPDAPGLGIALTADEFAPWIVDRWIIA